MKLTDLEESVGGLSKESKMPWLCWGIPASLCKTGSKLAKIKGTVCHACYAMKGAYAWKNTQAALLRRYNAWNNNPGFVADFVTLLIRKASRVPKHKRYFRWFPSGDLQNVKMLADIVRICHSTPEVNHYLPTKEHGIVSEYLKKRGKLPDNLTLRLSMPNVDQLPWSQEVAKRLRLMDNGVSYSAVVTDGTSNCPAYSQDNKCGDCRKCWDKSIRVIKYKLH